MISGLFFSSHLPFRSLRSFFHHQNVIYVIPRKSNIIGPIGVHEEIVLVDENGSSFLTTWFTLIDRVS